MKLVFQIIKPTDGLHNWDRPKPPSEICRIKFLKPSAHFIAMDNQRHIVKTIDCSTSRGRLYFQKVIAEARRNNWPHRTTMEDGHQFHG